MNDIGCGMFRICFPVYPFAAELKWFILWRHAHFFRIALTAHEKHFHATGGLEV
jgi:hypothetical protein